MADPRKDCPECKRLTLRRKIGAGAAIIFKGSGFYQTDYRSDSYKKAAEADKSSSEPAKASTDGKSTSDGKSSGDSSGSSKTEPAKAAAAPASSKSD
jgi:hypothetical protein